MPRPFAWCRWRDYGRCRLRFYNSDNRSEPWNREKFGSKANWRDETIPVSADGSVLGSPDDLGEGDEEEGDDAGETMHVILNKVNPKVQEIISV